MSEQIIIDMLKRIEQKVDNNTVATQANTTAVAVLTERSDNLIKRVDDIEEAATEAEKKAVEVAGKHDKLATRVATWAGMIAFIVTAGLTLAKEAIAAIIR